VIGAGAQVNDGTTDGLTALLVATRQERREVVEILRSAGAR
jgi:ankyrin repeat protein